MLSPIQLTRLAIRLVVGGALLGVAWLFYILWQAVPLPPGTLGTPDTRNDTGIVPVQIEPPPRRPTPQP